MSEREQLLARQQELKDRLLAIQRDLGRGLDKDFEEQAVQLENMEVLQEIARVAEEELRSIAEKLADLPPA